MLLDVQTLMVTMVTHLIALSVALPVIMGWRVSRAARCAQAGVAMQALGWVSVVLASGWYDRPLSTLAMACMATSHALLWESYTGWLGRRRGGRLVWSLALLTPLGYGLGFGHYAFRVGWANAGLALQLVMLCGMLLTAKAPAGMRWHLLAGGCLAAMAAVTTWRGVLGAFFTELYPTMRTPHPVNLAAVLLSNLTLLLNAVAMLVAWRQEAERALHDQARTDSLTALPNRRALQADGDARLARARRQGEPLALLLIDLDHFKQVNDRHGHEAGDHALQLMARLLRAQLRPDDLAGRWGGEEFCVLLACTDAAGAHDFDRRLRERLRRTAAAELGLALDHSSGLATLQPGDTGLATLLQRADAGLYAAKRAGRGRMAVAPVVAPAPRPGPAVGAPVPQPAPARLRDTAR